MNVLTTKKKEKKWAPVRQEKTAEQRKNEELYGRSAKIHGTNKKSDGQLMANAADWRNPNQTHTNSPLKKGGMQDDSNKNARDKKFDNLSSNILCNEDPNSKPPAYQTDVEALGKTSDWTAQAGSSKVINKGSKVDTFQKKKQ